MTRRREGNAEATLRSVLDVTGPGPLCVTEFVFKPDSMTDLYVSALMPSCDIFSFSTVSLRKISTVWRTVHLSATSCEFTIHSPLEISADFSGSYPSMLSAHTSVAKKVGTRMTQLHAASPMGFADDGKEIAASTPPVDVELELNHRYYHNISNNCMILLPQTTPPPSRRVPLLYGFFCGSPMGPRLDAAVLRVTRRGLSMDGLGTGTVRGWVWTPPDRRMGGGGGGGKRSVPDCHCDDDG